MLKELPVGPKGKKGVVWVSDPMIVVPSVLWDVVTTRGAGSVLEAMVFEAGVANFQGFWVLCTRGNWEAGWDVDMGDGTR